MIRIPYIRIKQRGEIFFVSKMKVSLLKEHVDLHFRDPYLTNQPEEEIQKFEEYIDQIRRKGLELATDNDEGVQRRLQLKRINDIRKYVEEKESNFFPNSIIISANVSDIENFDDDYISIESNEIGFFNLPDSIRFSVIDGQHRLAGLFLSDLEDVMDFELPIVLLFNVSLPTAAKLFADINGKQKAVNKSLIYDLYQYVSDEEFEHIKRYNKICQKFYIDRESPLFRQIKMLGTGSGAISQSFFIDMVYKYVGKTPLASKGLQEIYNHLYYYYKSFQLAFSDDWPVPKEFHEIGEVDKHAHKVLVKNKSQLLKTNGFGAIMRIFPDVFERSGGSLDSYLKVVNKFVDGDVKWKRDEIDQAGGGSAMQTHLYHQLSNCLDPLDTRDSD